MDFLTNFLPIIIVLILVLNLWGFYEQGRFTRFEGKLKRGLMIWAEPLSGEMRQYLETLPASVRHSQSFIRKEGREILICGEDSRSSFFNRRRQWSYVGYVNLSMPESRLEFRTSFFLVFSLIAALLIFIPIAYSFFLSFIRDGGTIWGCLLPIIFLIIITISFWINHQRQRKRLLDILKQAMEP